MTTFTVARDRLAPALKRAAGVVPTRTTILILQSVLLETSAEGLFVGSTDTAIVYREKVDDIAREPWSGCVDAQRLEAFVAGAEADGVNVRPDDEDRLRASAGRASCRLPTRPAEEFPRFHRPREGVVELAFDAPVFLVGLRAVAAAMSDEPARAYLNGAFLQAGRICATDGHRLSLRTLATDTPPAPDVIVPRGTVERLVPLLRGQDDPLSVAVAPTQVAFTMPGWSLVSKVIDGTFPDYRRVLPERAPAPLLVNRKALRDATALVASIHKNDKTTHALRLSATGGELVVTSLGDDASGTCEVSVPLEGKPREQSGPAAAWRTGLNSKYLLAGLDGIEGELVELHALPDPMAPLWLCAPGEAHDGAVIVPMRV